MCAHRYIDSHVHVWELERGDYGWIQPSNATLYRDYTPEDMKPLLEAFDVGGIVLVQAASTVAETEYMLSLADRHPFILGVVGSLDGEDAIATYRRLRAHPAFVGVRLNGGRLEPFATRPEQTRILEALAEDGAAVDLLVRPNDLPNAERLLERIPGLKAVVDHLGNPAIEAPPEERTAWRDGIARLAAYPNVAVKLSGMITLPGLGFGRETTGAGASGDAGSDAGPGGARAEGTAQAGTAAAPAHAVAAEALAPFVRDLFDAFGPRRLLFGSDWPVALRKGGYADVLRTFEAALPAELTEEERAAVRSGNAVAVYGLKRPPRP